MLNDDKRDIAIVVAGGSGQRMHSAVPKQFMELCGRPVLYYSLAAYEKSQIDKVVLVCSPEYISLAQEFIIGYGLRRTRKVVAGGAQRYDSVYEGLKAVNALGAADYIQVHDAARPMLTPEMIDEMARAVRKERALVAGVPVKDTIKIADEDKIVTQTPSRRSLYSIQTPQVFEYEELISAYEKMLSDPSREDITDDASVIEKYGSSRIHIFDSSYENIKLTTPEDMLMAQSVLERRNDENA